ncbi:MAG: molecular chaperone HtpG, partial [Proteobacteria bacterium]|nr:molecular chaperone HtpG [Pseudomonadota bacterium]
LTSNEAVKQAIIAGLGSSIMPLIGLKNEIFSGELKIIIATNKDKKMLIISDNGIGMNHDDLMQNLGTIAKSGTENFVKSLTGDKQKDIQLIGQFGVGFYSAFMIAKSVEVISRKYDDNKVWLWQSEGSSQFTLVEIDEQNPNYISNHGTKIILHLKSEPKEFLDRFHIKHVVQTYSDHINFPIDFVPENIEAGAKIETLNSASALWKKPKDQITDEQYQNFYKHISHLPNQPFMTIHNQVEGAVSYTNLLFIPSSKPFDLFHPDRKTSVKLFVKKVFISEELNLVPACMRFLRGLIDSDDLPLNISRESLQHSVVIDKIRKNVVNKVLSELKKKANDNEEKYLEFWNNFGAVLKEGLCESSEFREKIFLTGETVEKIKSSPQLEIFLQKDVEVLYLTDAVDEFWVTVALPYKDKELQSINRHDVDLENIDKKSEEKSEEDENEIKKDGESKDITTSQYSGLLDFIKNILGDKIQEARISKKLTDSPVCLAIDSRAMDIRLERYLLEQKQLNSASAKIFEINPNNKIIKKLNKNYQNEDSKNDAKDSIQTLFDLACIIEDEPIKDAKDFSRRLQKLLK